MYVSSVYERMAAAAWWTQGSEVIEAEAGRSGVLHGGERVEDGGEKLARRERERRDEDNGDVTRGRDDDEEGGGEGRESAFPWLEPGMRRDASGRSETHPLFDPSTLHVPHAALQNMTPFEKQVRRLSRVMWVTVDQIRQKRATSELK